MRSAPIALFVYNRPEHTRQTIDALLTNQEAAESDLYIFSDAAKSAAAESAVREVRQLIHKVKGFKSVNIIERPHNFGLAASIIEGVSLLCRQFGNVIVLEDDLLVSNYFLAYMNEALETYKDYDQVMQISGYMFPVELDIKDEAFFLPFTTSWGWATWHRAWQKFDSSAQGYAQLKTDAKLRKAFDLGGAYPYFKMLQSQLRGEIDSWAIRWYLSVFILKGMVLYPRNSMVKNIGMDGSGVHCGDSEQDERALKHWQPTKLPTDISTSSLPSNVVIPMRQSKLSHRFLSKIRRIL